jgi:hypothetical protein
MEHDGFGLINFLAFVGYILCGLVVGPMVLHNKDAPFKRKWAPRLGIMIGILFILFLWGIPWQVMLFFVIPSVALIAYINIRNTRYCDACGKMVYKHIGLPKRGHCPKCGARLND